MATAGGVALAVLAGGIYVLTTSSPRGALTGQPGPEAEAVALAEAYIEARNAYDADRARELVADDFRTTEPPDGYRDVSTMDLAFEAHRAYGFHYAEVDCAPESEISDPITVRCDFLWTNEFSALGSTTRRRPS